MPEKLQKQEDKSNFGKKDDFSVLSTRVVTKESGGEEINHDPLIDFFEAP